MVWQRPVRVTTHKITPKEATPSDRDRLIAEMGGWRVTDVTIGYISTDAQIGKKLTISVDLTNLTDKDITLHFPSQQKISISIRDQGGKVIYQTRPHASPDPTQQTIKATEGTYWIDQVDLTNPPFQASTFYTMTGTLLATDMPASATLVLQIM